VFKDNETIPYQQKKQTESLINITIGAILKTRRAKDEEMMNVYTHSSFKGTTKSLFPFQDLG